MSGVKTEVRTELDPATLRPGDLVAFNIGGVTIAPIERLTKTQIIVTDKTGEVYRFNRATGVAIGAGGWHRNDLLDPFCEYVVALQAYAIARAALGSVDRIDRENFSSWAHVVPALDDQLEHLTRAHDLLHAAISRVRTTQEKALRAREDRALKQKAKAAA